MDKIVKIQISLQTEFRLFVTQTTSFQLWFLTWQVLQRFRVKNPVVSKLTMDQGNLMRVTAQVHTQWKNNLFWRKSWHSVIQHGQQVQSCVRRDEHWLQHSRIITFCSETVHDVNVQNLIQKIKIHPHSKKVNYLIPSAKTQKKWFMKLEHRIVWTTQCWTQSTMQSMSVVLARRHRLLHVRSFLTRWYDKEQTVH